MTDFKIGFFNIEFDEKNKLFHAEIKGIPFAFSRQELEVFVNDAEIVLRESDPAWQKWAAEQEEIERKTQAKHEEMRKEGYSYMGNGMYIKNLKITGKITASGGGGGSKQEDLERVEGYKKGFIDAGISNLRKDKNG